MVLEQDSLCPHFKQCGGCKFLDLSYSQQLEQKQAQIEALFAGLPLKPQPIIPSSSIFHYRNKMEYTFSSSLKGEKFLGLLMRGRPNRVVNLESCLLSPPSFIEILSTVRRWWEKTEEKAYRPFQNTGSLRTLTLRQGRRTGETLVLLTVSGQEPPSSESLNLFVENLISQHSLKGIILRLQHTAKGTPTYFEERTLWGEGFIEEILWRKEKDSLRCRLRPTSFFQPNTEQAERIYQKVVELAAPSSQMVVGDLYCGIGTIGMFFAPHVSLVKGVELHADAVGDARQTILLNEVDNMDVEQGEVGATLWEGCRPSLVIVDPPRAGLHPKALSYLTALAPEKLIYVSCNPGSQAQDVEKLLTHGYRAYAIQPIDQFPHTPHVENIVALERCF